MAAFLKQVSVNCPNLVLEENKLLIAVSSCELTYLQPSSSSILAVIDVFEFTSGEKKLSLAFG